MIWPKHHSLIIWHNEHKARYETIEQYVNGENFDNDALPEDYKRILELDEIWECQLYPITPIGFIRIVVPTWERLVEEIGKIA
jgi:hypothetical protein